MLRLFRGMSAKDPLQYVERRRLRWNAGSESRGRTETQTAEEQLLHCGGTKMQLYLEKKSHQPRGQRTVDKLLEETTEG